MLSSTRQTREAESSFPTLLFHHDPLQRKQKGNSDSLKVVCLLQYLWAARVRATVRQGWTCVRDSLQDRARSIQNAFRRSQDSPRQKRSLLPPTAASPLWHISSLYLSAHFPAALHLEHPVARPQSALGCSKFLLGP